MSTSIGTNRLLAAVDAHRRGAGASQTRPGSSPCSARSAPGRLDRPSPGQRDCRGLPLAVRGRGHRTDGRASGRWPSSLRCRLPCSLLSLGLPRRHWSAYRTKDHARDDGSRSWKSPAAALAADRAARERGRRARPGSSTGAIRRRARQGLWQASHEPRHSPRGARGVRRTIRATETLNERDVRSVRPSDACGVPRGPRRRVVSLRVLHDAAVACAHRTGLGHLLGRRVLPLDRQDRGSRPVRARSGRVRHRQRHERRTALRRHRGGRQPDGLALP